ncbi:ORF6N domain-containing protein [Parabacteroides sp. OttesenSCG-928-G06]|nr:ORF6N domain-containing protein [Parabacteroides sp. OttesenSCG-928-G06]
MELQIIKDKIITIQEQQVILDSDVAELYGVETKRINEAVKNNPDKFPEGYIVQLSMDEAIRSRSKFSTLNKQDEQYNDLKSGNSTSSKMQRGQNIKYAPRAFTEKGLYMLATILKSPVATETTIAIIETFSKVRELSRTIAELSDQTDSKQQKSMMQKSGELISDILSDDFQTLGTETTIELNLSVLKVKHTVKKKPKE